MSPPRDLDFGDLDDDGRYDTMDDAPEAPPYDPFDDDMEMDALQREHAEQGAPDMELAIETAEAPWQGSPGGSDSTHSAWAASVAEAAPAQEQADRPANNQAGSEDPAQPAAAQAAAAAETHEDADAHTPHEQSPQAARRRVRWLGALREHLAAGGMQIRRPQAQRDLELLDVIKRQVLYATQIEGLLARQVDDGRALRPKLHEAARGNCTELCELARRIAGRGAADPLAKALLGTVPGAPGLADKLGTDAHAIERTQGAATWLGLYAHQRPLVEALGALSRSPALRANLERAAARERAGTTLRSSIERAGQRFRHDRRAAFAALATPGGQLDDMELMIQMMSFGWSMTSPFARISAAGGLALAQAGMAPARQGVRQATRWAARRMRPEAVAPAPGPAQESDTLTPEARTIARIHGALSRLAPPTRIRLESTLPPEVPPPWHARGLQSPERIERDADLLRGGTLPTAIGALGNTFVRAMLEEGAYDKLTPAGAAELLADNLDIAQNVTLAHERLVRAARTAQDTGTSANTIERLRSAGARNGEDYLGDLEIARAFAWLGQEEGSAKASIPTVCDRLERAWSTLDTGHRMKLALAELPAAMRAGQPRKDQPVMPESHVAPAHVGGYALDAYDVRQSRWLLAISTRIEERAERARNIGRTAERNREPAPGRTRGD